MEKTDILNLVECIAENDGGSPSPEQFKTMVIALLSYIYAATGGASTEAAATVGYSVVSAVGSVAAGKQSVSFNNVGSSNVTILGAILKPGKTVEFSAYLHPVTQIWKKLPAIAYDASGGGELAISTVE